MKVYLKILLGLLLLLPCGKGLAQPETPQILSSDMVLQQGQTVPIWGTASPKERVRVSFGSQSVTVRADAQGKWSVRLQPMQADKNPRQLVIKGEKNAITYDNIVVGEVWLCCGQSNMEYRMKLHPSFAPPAKGDDLAAKELQEPANPMIRVFISPREQGPAVWKTADGNTLENVSAAGYFFGKMLQQELNVPVGIITAALGGTRIETWTPRQAYEQSALFAPELARTGRIDGLGPGDRYDTQVAPLVPFAVKGVLWYQGENNCGIDDGRYTEKYKLMVQYWREAFGIPDLPFYSVLLAPHIYSDRMHRGAGRPVTAEALPLFWEQQIKTISEVPASDMIVISDLVDDLTDIHPSYKWEIGRRLARIALAKDYDRKEWVWSGPRLRDAQIQADSVILTFDHTADSLKISSGKRLRWFEVAASDGVFRPALADIRSKNKVVVYHPQIRQPAQVRFGWHETAMPNLVNSEGLPAFPFTMQASPGSLSQEEFRIARYRDDKVCAISYTFDDGLQEHYTVAAPELEKHGFRGTFWINGAKINEPDKPEADTAFLNWPQVRQMSGRGHEISNHSWSHPNLVRLNKEEILEQIEKNDSAILHHTGIRPLTFCYPYNAKNDTVLMLAAKGRIDTRTHQYSFGGKSTPENLEKRIEQMLEEETWGVAMTHGLHYGYDHFQSVDIFRDHLEKVKAREDRIWVGTFRQVAAYIKERDAVKIQVEKQEEGRYVLTPSIDLDPELFTEPLTAVIDRPGITDIRISQNGNALNYHIYTDKILFDFDPFGKSVEIEIVKPDY